MPFLKKPDYCAGFKAGWGFSRGVEKNSAGSCMAVRLCPFCESSSDMKYSSISLLSCFWKAKKIYCPSGLQRASR